MRSKLESAIEEAREIVLTFLDGDVLALPGACLYHAVAINHVLGAPIVAGSYSWRFTTHDDGTNPTHFSCIFDDAAKVFARRALTFADLNELPILPEMHVWNLWQGKVLDISTLHLPAFAFRSSGFQFESSLNPPSYHFGKAVDHKRGNFLYRSDPIATALARAAASSLAPK